MAKNSKREYKPGDKMVIYIPKDADEDTMAFINGPKKLSPTIMRIIEEVAKQNRNNILINKKNKE